jgi:very-short-patch-repair endonuclease
VILPGTGRGTAAGGGGGVRQIPRAEVSTARQLRRTMSLPEVLLWQRLRGSRTGAKFRRQHPIGPYIVDFYCSEAGLIIEVDGEAHDRGERPGRDGARAAFLAENGYRVVRVPASDVLRDADGVATAVVSLASRPLHHSPAASGPPPRAEEDL